MLSPQLVSSSGESYKSASFQLDWSIGELQTETYTNGSALLTQGFHQNNYIVTAIDEPNGITYQISASPNPTTNFIYLRIESPNNQHLQYQITDFRGEVLQNEKISDNNQQINFSDFAFGSYFIFVRQNNQLVKSFKIIKN